MHTIQQGPKSVLDASHVRLTNQFTVAKIKVKVHSRYEDLNFRQRALTTQHNTSQI